MNQNDRQRNHQRSGRASAYPRSKGKNGKSQNSFAEKSKQAASLVSSRSKDIPPNAYVEVKNIFSKMFDTPLEAALGICGFIVTVHELMGIFGITDQGNAGGGSHSSFDGSFLVSNFQMRILTFTIIAVCISVTVAFICKLLTLTPRPALSISAHIVTFMGAFLLTGVFGRIFEEDLVRLTTAALFASVMGMGFSIFLVKMIYTSAHEKNLDITTSRAGLLANLAVSSAFGVIILFVEAS